MKKQYLTLAIWFLSLFVFCVSNAFSSEKLSMVKIIEPHNGSVLPSPVKVCMDVLGVEVEPAKSGVNEGKGHHHLLIDAHLPSDLSQPVGKDAQHVHMGDGSTCKSLELGSSLHVIRTLFARGNHVPYDPPLSDAIWITVK
ncbi:MAG: DUF4399 domain-containing protein [Nitrospinales bacterium]